MEYQQFAYAPRPAVARLLQPKEDMKERGLPSPNEGDALALTFAQPVMKKVRHRAGTGVKAAVDYDVYG